MSSHLLLLSVAHLHYLVLLLSELFIISRVGRLKEKHVLDSFAGDRRDVFLRLEVVLPQHTGVTTAHNV